IESGVDDSVSLYNSKWLDISSMLLFLGFFVCEVFLNYPAPGVWLAFLLFIVNAVRLIGWHTAGIWRKSLLWSIYLSFWFITFGFLLFAAADLAGISKYLAIHAFAYGGIGLITIGMMSRVALGHTGRLVSEPPASAAIAFALLIAGAMVRVRLPIVSMANYDIWIGLSQLLWVIAFAIFVITYMPILIKPRLG
ncbi:MAG: NnrS family protein, partial [Gammaproteobacteria bacterium]|nr:NnrS family protein [Gammaproteobacteria bacterium]